VVLDLGQLALAKLGVFDAGAGSKCGAAMGQKLAENRDDVFGALALAEHDFGEAGAQTAVVVDAGEPEIGKRKLGQTLHGGLDFKLSRRHLREKVLESCFIHGENP
jgi:hypothetical protein